MKRFFAWLAGFVGGAAAYRFWRRRPPPPAMGLPSAAPDPAEALKAKLAEARASEDAPEESDVESRRRSVHERARTAIDEMQGPDEG